MKILFWVPYSREGPSNRYRVEQYLPYLEKAGIKYTLSPFWSSSAFKILYKNGCFFKKTYFFILGIFSRLLDLLRVLRYEAVFIHREACPIGGDFFERMLALFRKPFIFDFDDAIFFPSSSLPNSFIERFKNPDKVSRIIKESAYVIAGNKYLADFAFNFNDKVGIIPTPIDTDKYCPRESGEGDGKIVIGWIGSVTTLDFLRDLKDTFVILSKRFPRLFYKIIGGQLFIDGVPNIINKEWSQESELEELRSFDIGIMPMPDNKWTRGKCGFKAIIYMSIGLPCVCSPVGVNKEIIKDGVNGFLAQGQGEWLDRLSLLIENSQLRKKIGAAARRSIEERYSLKANAPKFLEVMQRFMPKTDFSGGMGG